MPLPIDQYLRALRREGDALAAAAERSGLTASVEPCPGWTVADLLWHTGEVHHSWRTVAADRPSEMPAYEPPPRPPDDQLLDWYRGEIDALEAVLRDADPSAPCWTWTSQHDVAWIQRRMAQETAVHRWDAEAAAGDPQPIDTSLAIDGIDEFLQFFRGAETSLDGTVHLHATDAEGEWLVRLAGGQVAVEQGHAKGDAAIRGAASDLLLVLWRRRSLDALEVFGDAALAQAFVDEPALD